MSNGVQGMMDRLLDTVCVFDIIKRLDVAAQVENIFWKKKQSIPNSKGGLIDNECTAWRPQVFFGCACGTKAKLVEAFTRTRIRMCICIQLLNNPNETSALTPALRTAFLLSVPFTRPTNPSVSLCSPGKDT